MKQSRLPAAVLALPVLGSYADTTPLDCPKTDAIITRTADFIVRSKKFGREGFPTPP